MNNDFINKIVWWIPFKKLRNCFRNFLLEINFIISKIYAIDSKVNAVESKINYLNNVVKQNLEFFDQKNIVNIYNYPIKRIYEYDFIFSIGMRCYTAEILSINKLRTKSSPFDWISYHNEYLDTHIFDNMDLIINRFSNFFNKEDIMYISKGVTHDIYFNTKNNIYFMHDFVHNANFDTEYDNVYSKYKRRINNLIYNLENNKKILMVYIESYLYNTNFLDITKLLNKIIRIRKNYNNSNVDLLYLRHNHFYSKEVINFNLISDKIHLYILNNSFRLDESIYNENTNIYLPNPNGKYEETWIGDMINTSKILSRYKLIC